MGNRKEDVLNTYTFECSYGDIITDEKPIVKVREPGIYLHFLRYGLFDRNATEDSHEVSFNEKTSTNETVAAESVKVEPQQLIKLKDNNLERFSIKIDNTRTASRDHQTTIDRLNEKEITLNEITTYGIVDLPHLENFYTHPTSLNAGYIYLLNEEDPDDYYELLIHPDGWMQHIDWEYSKNIGDDGEVLDIRIPDKNDKIKAKRITPEHIGKKLWVAYSPVQWSKDYHTKMNSDKELRKKRMRLIDCVPLKKKATKPVTNDDDSQHKIQPISYKETEAVYINNKDPRATVLHQTMQDIDAFEQNDDKEGDNENYEELFFVIHDPLGCAEDISEVVAEKTIQFKALVDSVQSGESIEDAKERISSGNLEVPRPKKNNGEIDVECEQLFTLALTCYQLVYNDNKSILKYDGGAPGWFNPGGRHSLDPRPMFTTYTSREYGMQVVKNTALIGYEGVDYAKLKGILGIDQRNNARTELLSYREDLGKMVSCDYLKKYLDNYLDNHPERILEGRNVLLETIDPLSFHPYKFDQHLQLHKDIVAEDKWVNWVYKVTDDISQEDTSSETVTSESKQYAGLDPIVALLGTALNIDKLLTTKESLSKKAVGVYKKILQYKGGQAANYKVINGVLLESIEDKQKFIVSKLNKVTFYNTKMFEIVDGDIWMTLEKHGVILDPEYVKLGRYKGKREDILRILQESHGKEGFTYRTVKKANGTSEVQINARVARDLSDDAVAQKNYNISKIVNGRAFNGVFALLEINNFSMAIIKVTKEESTLEDDLKAFGSAVVLTSSFVSLRKAHLVHIGIDPSAKFLKNATRLSIVGGAISVGWCFYDAFKLLDKRDMDSGLAMVGAAVAFGISTMAGAGIIFAATGPVGWIAALIGVGFVIVSSLLTDTPLEEYFKNFLLSDREAFYSYSSPVHYSKRILANRSILTNDDFHDTLKNPLDAQAKLFDHIMCKQIGFTPINPETTSFTTMPAPGTYAIPTVVKTEKAYRFQAKMVFSRFFNNKDQVEAHAFFYAQGVDDGNPVPMAVSNTEKIYDEQGGAALQVIFTIPVASRNLIRQQSEIVFAVRLHIDEEHSVHFPYPVGGEERYLGAKLRVQSLSAGLYQTSLKQDEDVVVGTLANLKTDKPW
ncbi:hypothetical protein JAO71_03745 [Olleya sp. YSTF-M6]|uniref:Toxin VasX N-terminal region domain-containing protein n=1 Tax=Olleya sediminilitoris TaxID=2795739 RepID=A0ABS1WIK5_9FLAO|nr:toxin VasX [Olleya sediminilitoris]MBL7558908.1 hypothetical protein [Olleya sediminilitoris]